MDGILVSLKSIKWKSTITKTIFKIPFFVVLQKKEIYSGLKYTNEIHNEHKKKKLFIIFLSQLNISDIFAVIANNTR